MRDFGIKPDKGWTRLGNRQEENMNKLRDLSVGGSRKRKTAIDREEQNLKGPPEKNWSGSKILVRRITREEKRLSKENTTPKNKRLRKTGKDASNIPDNSSRIPMIAPGTK